MSLEVLAMMGAGVPPNVAHFNQDKLAVKYPLLLKFGNSTTQVAQDLMITLALSEVKAGKKVQFVTERPLTRFPVQGPKNLPPPPQLLDGIDFWYCKTLRSLCKMFGRLHALEDLPDVVIMHDLESMLQDSQRFSFDVTRCCGILAQTFEHARQEKEIPFYVTVPRTPLRETHQLAEDRAAFAEIPFVDYFPAIWRLKSVADKAGVVSLRTERGLDVALKVHKGEGMQALTMRLPTYVLS